jgi:hypothetical protein
MWLMKRTIVDGWDVDKAMTEATALGLANETLKQFFLDQIRQRKGPRFVPFHNDPAPTLDFGCRRSSGSGRGSG